VPLVLLGGACLIATGCQTTPTITRDQLEADFMAKTESMDHQSKQAFGDRRRIMGELIARVPAADRDAMYSVRIAPGSRFANEEAEQIFWEQAIDDLMFRQRWDQVTGILAVKPIEYVGGCPVEYLIAIRHGIRRVDVLGNAYRQARDQTVKEAIARAFRRGFPELGSAECDRLLIEQACVNIAAGACDDLTINKRYCYIISAPPRAKPGLIERDNP
jgi:hypothetical protein